MNEGGSDSARIETSPRALSAVEARIEELQRRKRQTVRWHMSRDTAERAIAAITTTPVRPRATSGKSRRRKRHKRYL